MPDTMEENKGVHPSFFRVIKEREDLKNKLAGIKKKIGVYSAKGGVGKTTVAVNLAYTLKNMGYSVGLLDADIDCPNVTMFTGISEKMDTSSLPLKPIIKDGIKIASTAMIVDDTKKPIIWRGPLIAKMVSDFLENTDWGGLDYLVIDLPPGTSDAPLSIMQLLDLTGFVLVTNPSRISSVNSIRSGMMAKRLNVAVLGVVENMSEGAESKNTEELVKAVDAPLLGRIPYLSKFRELSDSGSIPVNEDPEIGKAFAEIAKKLE